VSAGAGPRFEVRVVDEVLTEDLARCTPAARAAIEPMVTTLRDKGAPREWLLRCEAEGHLIAVGERHPPQPWKRSVYEIAHRRLHR
jgi:hypothetical protein